MQFYLRQGTDPDALFSVMEPSGQLVYRVKGDALPIGGKFYLLDSGEKEVARIFSVGVTAISKYAIQVGDKERARVTWNFNAKREQVKIKGVHWRFRGDLATRSYDILDIDSSVVMTHGRCWNKIGDCYAVQVANESDALLCLCLAVILDSTVIGGAAAPVPAG